jgi:transcriptional regulator with XRE-family HTH domain
MNYAFLTKELKNKRKSLNLSQQKLSELAQVSLPTIQNIEAGKSNPTIDVLNRISQVLGFNINLSIKQTDWNLLSILGVPITNNKIKSSTKPYKDLLLLELKKVIVNIDIHQNNRYQTAVAATLLALKTHWPSTFNQFGQLKNKINLMIESQDAAALLKLRRISIEKLSVYL